MWWTKSTCSEYTLHTYMSVYMRVELEINQEAFCARHHHMCNMASSPWRVCFTFYAEYMDSYTHPINWLEFGIVQDYTIYTIHIIVSITIVGSTLYITNKYINAYYSMVRSICFASGRSGWNSVFGMKNTINLLIYKGLLVTHVRFQQENKMFPFSFEPC